mmetsp:Transcript_99863/g.286900  ORF Transcript_99863/g.286900 Transcript_99863/m.286900 type:complete len:220 (+) Transcript_99863:1871-2530(+)
MSHQHAADRVWQRDDEEGGRPYADHGRVLRAVPTQHGRVGSHRGARITRVVVAHHGRHCPQDHRDEEYVEQRTGHVRECDHHAVTLDGPLQEGGDQDQGEADQWDALSDCVLRARARRQPAADLQLFRRLDVAGEDGANLQDLVQGEKPLHRKLSENSHRLQRGHDEGDHRGEGQPPGVFCRRVVAEEPSEAQDEPATDDDDDHRGDGGKRRALPAIGA